MEKSSVFKALICEIIRYSEYWKLQSTNSSKSIFALNKFSSHNGAWKRKWKWCGRISEIVFWEFLLRGERSVDTLRKLSLRCQRNVFTFNMATTNRTFKRFDIIFEPFLSIHLHNNIVSLSLSLFRDIISPSRFWFSGGNLNSFRLFTA